VKVSLFPEYISRWLSSKSARSEQFTLSQKNIYIFPSRMGFVFFLLIVLLLLTAINYQNSLIYLFTFFLGAVFFVSIMLCFLNMNGLCVSSFQVLACYEGELRPHVIELLNTEKPSMGLRLGVDKHILTEMSINKGVKKLHNILLPTDSRGVHVLDRLRIESTFPFGFIIAWTWLKLDSKVLVFPKPVEGVRSLEGGVGSESKNNSRLLSEDLTELKSYQHGDSALRIVWKQLAAKDQLIIRSHEQGTRDSIWLTWRLYDVANIEKKLQHLCFDILDLHRKQQVYGLDIPGALISPSMGERHKYECLKVLALFSLGAEEGQND
jgi:uncharacterized protein (DUF58 family)